MGSVSRQAAMAGGRAGCRLPAGRRRTQL